MRGLLGPALAGLVLATAMAGAAARSPDPVPAPAAATTATRSAPAPEPSIRHLQQAVSAAEARRKEIQRRLVEQDREIQALRRQLQAAGNHESTPLH